MKLVTKLLLTPLTIINAGLMVLAAIIPAEAVSLTYDRQIGKPGFAPGELFVPQGIGVQDSTGNLFVSNGRGLNPDGSFNANLGNRVDVFDPQGNYLKAIGTGVQGKGAGLDEPADLKFQPGTGLMHVGDVFNSEIDVYNPNNGEYVRSYGSFGGRIEGRPFFGPGGMTFDNNNQVWITDFSGDVIKIYDANNGNLLKTVGSSGTGNGQFQGPAGISFSQKTGRVYVGDQFNARVKVLDGDGNSLFAFGTPGSGPGQFEEPIGVEIDEFDNVYVADSQNSRVQVFDKDGKFLSTFGQPARNAEGQVVPPPAPGGLPFGDPLQLEPGVFNWTGGAHYDRGKLYVGDFFQGRVQVLNVKGQDEGRKKVPEPTTLLSFGLLGLVAGAMKFQKHRQEKTLA
jgi:DNA-binding beta-propeller fold protein YncE